VNIFHNHYWLNNFVPTIYLLLFETKPNIHFCPEPNHSWSLALERTIILTYNRGTLNQSEKLRYNRV
jgi:hypothetical protein